MIKPPLIDELGIVGHLSWENESPFFQDALQIVEPKCILETGFFCGMSAFINLYLSDAMVISVDPMVNPQDPNGKHDGLIENVEKLKNAFPGRFTFIQKDSRNIRPDLRLQQIDLMFIDGDHSPEGIRNDFQLAIDLNIPWILVDDFVTDVARVYDAEFANEFLPVRIYPRKDQFQGKPIPIVLLKKINKALQAKIKQA